MSNNPSGPHGGRGGYGNWGGNGENRGNGGEGGDGGGRGRGGGRRGPNNSARRELLARTAQQTLSVLPHILAQRPELKAYKSTIYDSTTTMTGLDPSKCPRLPRTKVAVVNDDTFDAAIRIGKESNDKHSRVAVLNFASHRNPGGGWLKGASAQEEALCFRSSLSLSLPRKYYPFTKTMGVYTGDVLIIRTAMDAGHKLMVRVGDGTGEGPSGERPELAATPVGDPPFVDDPVRPSDLPVVSVLTVAAVNGPPIARIPGQRPTYANPDDRSRTKDKMRLTLRMAATHGHRSVVLGAFGCGAFRNPVGDVAACWSEVLGEPEFSGGWWKNVCFAVYDRRREGNYEAFKEILEGQDV